MGACRACNEHYSKDEEYLACLIECVIQGSTDPDHLQRENIAEKLRNQPGLRSKLEQARTCTAGVTIIQPEMDRVSNVVRKLAQCHVLYELSEVMRQEPDQLWAVPIEALDDAKRRAFENIEQPPIWPEVGCRMSSRLVSGDPGWQFVQPGRYRYATIFGGPTVARMVLSEYLACEVVWHD